jgi:hypothetical protein
MLYMILVHYTSTDKPPLLCDCSKVTGHVFSVQSLLTIASSVCCRCCCCKSERGEGVTHGIEEKQFTCKLPMADSIFIKMSTEVWF